MMCETVGCKIQLQIGDALAFVDSSHNPRVFVHNALESFMDSLR